MIKLIHGECLEEMDKLIEQGIIFDAIVTDPPYQKTRNKWDTVIPLDEMWGRLLSLSKKFSPIILFGQNSFSFKLGLSNEDMFRYTLIWEKTKAGGFLNANRMPLQAHEDILVFYKNLPTYNPQFSEGTPYIKKAVSNGDGRNYGKFERIGSVNINEGKRYPRSVLKISNDNHNSLHPTQKPVALMEYLIKTYTNENDTILDFTMGSGTTILAAKNLNRNAYGIEKDEKYFEITKERMR